MKYVRSCLLGINLLPGIFGSYSPAFAADPNGLYQTLSLIGCEGYVQNRKDAAKQNQIAVEMIYVSGWLSSYNYLMPNTYNIVPDQNLATAMKWLDRFCADNPKSALELGLIKMTTEWYPKRMQKHVDPKASSNTSDGKTKVEKKAAVPAEKPAAAPKTAVVEKKPADKVEKKSADKKTEKPSTAKN